MKLIEFKDKGIFCPVGGFYIDPWRPVEKAFITHGHSDHARWGHKQYICTSDSVPILKHRLGSSINVHGQKYGEPIRVNGVSVSFHPAGHIIGSAQVRIEYKGEIWVISGDYKLANDQISTPFVPIKCHHFVTETTFGLPIYNWPCQSNVFDQINQWWLENKIAGVTSVIGAYSLGKAQRILQGLDENIGDIYTHSAITNINETLIKWGLPLKKTIKLIDGMNKEKLRGSMIIVPPASLNSNWMNRLKETSTAFASGWMAIRGHRRRRSADRGFVLSDHCDWKELQTAVDETGAENIYPTHGYTSIFAQWLTEKGYRATEVRTEFEGESLDLEES